MTVALYCTQCGMHLYDREAGMFQKNEMVGPEGMSRPDGRAVEHGSLIHYCGCASPAKGEPSLTDVRPE